MVVDLARFVMRGYIGHGRRVESTRIDCSIGQTCSVSQPIYHSIPLDTIKHELDVQRPFCNKELFHLHDCSSLNNNAPCCIGPNHITLVNKPQRMATQKLIRYRLQHDSFVRFKLADHSR